jgi:O-antigen ligase
MSAIHQAGMLMPRESRVPTRSRHAFLFWPARIALVATLIAAPLAFGAVEGWAWMSLGLGACVTLLLWIAGVVNRKVLRLNWSPMYIPLAAFLLLALTRYLAGHTLDESETREALVLFAVDVTFFFLAVQLLGESGGHASRWFGLTVLLFTGLLGLFSILEFGSATKKIYWRFDTNGGFFGPYSNPDHYAGLMEMLVPVGVCYIAARRKKDSVAVLMLLGLASILAAASLLLTGSRGGLLALSTEIVIAGVMLRRKAHGAQSWSLIATLAGGAVAILLLFSWIDPGQVAKRLGSIFEVPGQVWIDTTEFRKRAAVDSLRMLRDHPAFGVGLGNFEIAYPPYQSFPSDATIDYAHDDYLQAAAETGLAGAAIIIAALAFFFRLSFHGLARRLLSDQGWIQLGAALGCCGLLVHSFVDFNLHIPANAAWFAALAGVAIKRS